MHSKTFRRKNGKMSRRRRGGEGKLTMTRQTSGELTAMEEGRPGMTTSEMPMLGRSTTAELSNMEEGAAPTAPPIEMMNDTTAPSAPPIEMMNDTTAPNPTYNTSDELEAMETGSADIESGFGSGRGGKKRVTKKSRKSRKSRKGRKTRKGGKRRK